MSVTGCMSMWEVCLMCEHVLGVWRRFTVDVYS